MYSENQDQYKPNKSYRNWAIFSSCGMRNILDFYIIDTAFSIIKFDML